MQIAATSSAKTDCESYVQPVASMEKQSEDGKMSNDISDEHSVAGASLAQAGIKTELSETKPGAKIILFTNKGMHNDNQVTQTLKHA